MKTVLGLFVLFGMAFFLGREWFLGTTFAPQIIMMPGFVTVQLPGKSVYLFGDKELFAQRQLFGYFFDEKSLIEPSQIPAGNRELHLSRWHENFTVLQVANQRLFWFGPEFEWSDIARKPIILDSQIWLLDKTTPPANIPPPDTAIIWYDAHKRVPKKLKELSSNHQLPLLAPAQAGQFQLQYKDGHWALD